MEKQHDPTDFIKRILIVDDDEVERYILRRTIISAMPAKEIIEANSGERALAILREREAQRNPMPELVFLDVNMSPMSGLEFLDVFEKMSNHSHSHCRIIMICSKDDETEKQTALSHPHVAGYYVKPITPETLLRISDHLNHKQAS